MGNKATCVFSRRDRVELGVLGLVVLAWGLLVAPLVHSFTHAHGHRHTHGVPSKGAHAEPGTVEHLLAVATETPPAVDPIRIGVLLTLAELQEPLAPSLSRWNPVEQPQGP
jgi:hypothetical protein